MVSGLAIEGMKVTTIKQDRLQKLESQHNESDTLKAVSWVIDSTTTSHGKQCCNALSCHPNDPSSMCHTKTMLSYKALLLGHALEKARIHNDVKPPRQLNSVSLPMLRERGCCPQVQCIASKHGQALTIEAFHGMLRTIALEAPHLKLQVTRQDYCIPLEQLSSPLVANLSSNSYGTELSANCVSYPLLVRTTDSLPTSAAKHGCQAHNSILITGGLGGLGLLIVEWAKVGKRASRLLALGRSGRCDLAGWRSVMGWMDHSTEAIAQGCDTSAQADVVGMGCGRPSVVVHSGGVLQDAKLSNQESRQLRKVMAPKVVGIDLLARYAGVGEADMTLVFSSVTSFMGTIGQTNYAMANAMLDAWADNAKMVGVPARSIQWGAWGGVGMAAGNKMVLASLQGRGLSIVEPIAGLMALRSAWFANAKPRLPGILLATPLNGSKLQRIPDTKSLASIFLDLFAESKATKNNVKPTESLSSNRTESHAMQVGFKPNSNGIANQAGNLTPFASLRDVRADIKELIGGILGEMVDESTPLMEAGLDSLGIVELKNEIESKFDLQVPATLALDYPTVADLATLVHGMMSVTRD
eukprot:scaffold58365_cov47-Prasinocladus_malaysianus.AAC.1